MCSVSQRYLQIEITRGKEGNCRKTTNKKVDQEKRDWAKEMWELWPVDGISN